MAERDYVLGTDAIEDERLGLQHRVWRPEVLTVWRQAGITAGSKVLDVGCGPGHATADLAQIVGSRGRVIAFERSARFLDQAHERCAEFPWVEFVERDLMDPGMGIAGFDFAWCRWVASFVPDPKKLVNNIAGALRQGGKVIFHDYLDYEGWTITPETSTHQKFVSAVVSNWVRSGGTPNVARVLPSLLIDAGFRIDSVKPLNYLIRPNEFMWQWPKTFIESHAPRLVEAGALTQNEVDKFMAEFYAMEKDEKTILFTPTVAEIVAVKSRA